MVLKAAEKEALLFGKLDVRGTFNVGRFEYLRLMADTENLLPVLKRLSSEGGRSVVCESQGSYVVTLPDGRSGTVPVSTMHTIPAAGQRHTYKGPKIKRWARQFYKNPE